VIERQSTSSIRLSLKTQVLRVDPCAAVWLPVGGAWSMYGMRCADLCGLVAFARCAARSLYMMRCADLCGLVAFCRAVRLQFCAVRLRRFVLRMRMRMRVACALHGTVSWGGAVARVWGTDRRAHAYKNGCQTDGVFKILPFHSPIHSVQAFIHNGKKMPSQSCLSFVQLFCSTRPSVCAVFPFRWKHGQLLCATKTDSLLHEHGPRSLRL
jgi:hypothetical protein